MSRGSKYQGSIRCGHPDCTFTLPFAPQTFESQLMRAASHRDPRDYKNKITRYYCKRPADIAQVMEKLEKDLQHQPERKAKALAFAEKMMEHSRDCLVHYKFWSQKVLDMMEVLHELQSQDLSEEEVEEKENFFGRQKELLQKAVEEVVNQHADGGGDNPVHRVAQVYGRLRYEGRKGYREEKAQKATEAATWKVEQKQQ